MCTEGGAENEFELNQSIDEASTFAGTAAAAKSFPRSTNCEDSVAAVAVPLLMLNAPSG